MTTPGGRPRSTLDFSAVGRQLDAYVPGTVRGYAILILDRYGRLYTHYKGTVWPWTVMPLASASKLAAVATIMTLVDQGKLDLDVPVSRYVAGHLYWPAADTVTLRMLLNHTSGIPGIGPADLPPNPYPYCLGNQSGNLSLQQCAQRIALLPPDAPPGSTFNYGGADYQMAGYIATLAAGRDWDSLVHDALAVPLQMPSLTFQPNGGNPRIAGGAMASAKDYAHLLRMLLSSGAYGATQFLTAGSVAQIEHNGIAGLPITFTPASPALYPGYGLGVFLTSPSLYSGSPGPEFSDPGLLGATPWFDPGLGYAAVLFIDPDPSSGDLGNVTARRMWDQVRPIIIGQLAPH